MIDDLCKKIDFPGSTSFSRFLSLRSSSLSKDESTIKSRRVSVPAYFCIHNGQRRSEDIELKMMRRRAALTYPGQEAYESLNKRTVRFDLDLKEAGPNVSEIVQKFESMKNT